MGVVEQLRDKTHMEDLLSEEELQQFMHSLGCEDFLNCEPPPLFDLPPPPLPPMVDTAPECDNMPLVTSINSVQHIFHNIIIITVSSIIIIMSVILMAMFVRRRWKNLMKQLKSQNLQSPDMNLEIVKPTNLSKDSEIVHNTRQNYYISDHHEVLRQNIPVIPLNNHHPPILIIGGVPFHIVRQLNSSSHSSNLSDQKLPIYETIESDFYSEMSSLESDRGEVGSTTYQEIVTPVTHSLNISPVNQYHTHQPDTTRISATVPTTDSGGLDFGYCSDNYYNTPVIQTQGGRHSNNITQL